MRSENGRASSVCGVAKVPASQKRRRRTCSTGDEACAGIDAMAWIQRAHRRIPHPLRRTAFRQTFAEFRAMREQTKAAQYRQMVQRNAVFAFTNRFRRL